MIWKEWCKVGDVYVCHIFIKWNIYFLLKYTHSVSLKLRMNIDNSF